MKRLKIHFQKALLLFSFAAFCNVLMGQELEKTTSMDSQEIEDSFNNNIKVRTLLFTGLLFENQEKKQTWYIPSLFELFPSNTVEGFVFNPNVSFTQYLQNGKFYNLKPGLRYGFGEKQLRGQLAAQLYYAPSKKASIQLSGGNFVEEFNPESTLSALNNTFYTFLLDENFLKIYDRTYVEIGHSFAPIKDFLLTTTLSWNDRQSLRNLPEYSKEDSNFTSNAPINNELQNTEFEDHQAFLWNAKLRWQFGHQYIRQRGAFKSISNYPAITISYSGALSEVLGSDLSYQKIALQITEDFRMRKGGRVKFLFEMGDFISKDELTFVDFKHFNGKRTVYGDFTIGDFQLLDYYQYSTTGFYLQSHYEHQFTPIAIRNGKMKFQPVASVNYLYTPSEGSYWELGVGVNKLLKMWRVDFYSSWRDGKQESTGIRFGVVFD